MTHTDPDDALGDFGHKARYQRRTLLVLTGSQVLGGVGVASGFAVTALLARELSGSESLAGLGTTAQVFGGALLAVPLARIMAARGRRPGLALGYVIASVGALLVVTAAILRWFPLLLLGTTLLGGAATANSQTRFAAADLAEPRHIGRDIGLVLWAATVGSVLGPNLVHPAEALGRALRLPPLAGSFVLALVGFLLAALLLMLFLRPDPLIVARAEEEARTASSGSGSGSGAASAPVTHRVSDGLRLIARHSEARLGLLVLTGGHAVMVGVMVMTPLHMAHGGAELHLIGLVISLHVLGMYAFSPLTGLAVDRFGGRAVAVGGGVLLLTACLAAAQAQTGMSSLLTVALVLLGVGWSGTLVSGSILVTQPLAAQERAATQGVTEMVMGLAGGGAGACAGVVLHHAGYPALCLIGAVVSVVVLAAPRLIPATPPAAPAASADS